MSTVLDKTRALAIDVIIESDLWDAVADAETTVRRAIAQAAGATDGRSDGREVAVLLTDDAAIRRLSDQWRGLDKPTNVLSFPAAPQSAGAGHGTGAPAPLGDIAIAYETMAREAETEDKPLAHHLSHLAVHGFLHLLGYDHESDGEAETMERLERVILARLGVPDPYLTHESVTPETRG